MTKAYDLASAKSAADVIGDPVQDLPKASLKAESNIAYAFSWVNDDAAPLLAELSQTRLPLRTVTKPMRVQTTEGSKI